MKNKDISSLILLSVIFIVTGFFAWYTSNVRTGDRGNFQQPESSVSISDTANVSKIVLETSLGKVLLVKSENGEWTVNNTMKARRQLIQFLLYGLHELKVKRALPQNNRAVSVKILMQEGTKVTIHTRGESSKVFYVAANKSDLNTSIYMDDERQPWIVNVPGVKGNIATLLSLKVDDWQTKEIFNASLSNIKKIVVKYADQQRKGFEIIKDFKGFAIQDLPNADGDKVNKYVNLFPILNAEKYLSNDSIPSMEINAPDASLQITTSENSVSELRIYFDRKNQLVFGRIIPSGQFVLLNPRIFKFVLIDKQFFIKKNSS